MPPRVIYRYNDARTRPATRRNGMESAVRRILAPFLRDGVVSVWEHSEGQTRISPTNQELANGLVMHSVREALQRGGFQAGSWQYDPHCGMFAVVTKQTRRRTATRRNPKMEGYPCSRCGGTGRLSGYSHVVGGVCFKCHGTGTQTAKPSTKAAKWAVHFPKTVERPTSIDQGDDFVYIVSAKSPDQAVLKATTTFLGSRIRHEFTERGAWAEPYEEYMARFYAE